MDYTILIQIGSWDERHEPGRKLASDGFVPVERSDGVRRQPDCSRRGGVSPDAAVLATDSDISPSCCGIQLSVSRDCGFGPVEDGVFILYG